jgi:hypothetical protein
MYGRTDVPVLRSSVLSSPSSFWPLALPLFLFPLLPLLPLQLLFFLVLLLPLLHQMLLQLPLPMLLPQRPPLLLLLLPPLLTRRRSIDISSVVQSPFPSFSPLPPSPRG